MDLEKKNGNTSTVIRISLRQVTLARKKLGPLAGRIAHAAPMQLEFVNFD
jgi:hypothetical protein